MLVLKAMNSLFSTVGGMKYSIRRISMNVGTEHLMVSNYQWVPTATDSLRICPLTVLVPRGDDGLVLKMFELKVHTCDILMILPFYFKTNDSRK